MKSEEIRQRFLDFFKQRGHRLEPSDSLVPTQPDPTVLFTPAGMNQFKGFFLGMGKLAYTRAATCQKCLRTGDIENVGKTAGHHTFFEMLGNFSFGDYFKQEAIAWAWEFLLEVMKLDSEKLLVSVYEEDDEAYGIWEREIGVPTDRIYHFGADENFWPKNAKELGPNGPCGPCSEIFFDQGEELSCGRPECDPSCGCDRYVEVWNLVFTQFERQEGGVLEPLPKPNIDTGMGMERLTAVIEGAKSNFETDLFRPYIEAVCDIARVEYPGDKESRARIRRIVDHARALVFCIGDGVMPGNTGRSYVVRRLLRRASLDGRKLGIHTSYLYKLVPVVIDKMKRVYPELRGRRENIALVVKAEEEKFDRTLDQGAALLDNYIKELQEKGEKTLSGERAFVLHDRLGVPLEITESILAERGLTVNKDGFEKEMKAQKELARSRSDRGEGIFFDSLGPRLKGEIVTGTKFDGYKKTDIAGAKLLFIAKVEENKDLKVKEARAGDNATLKLVLDRTPFYAEAGGQVGDAGTISGEGFNFRVEDTQRDGDYVIHVGKLTEGTVKVGAEVEARVDLLRRQAIKRHHTATHLLHWALRQVLGAHAQQSGSLVHPDYLRFDFTHPQAMTDEEVAQVEKLVNERVCANLPIAHQVTTLEKARASGAIALFGEKYGEKVRLVTVGEISKELCGGTHLDATGEVGAFKILSEESIGSGLRRITAVGGVQAIETWQKRDKLLKELSLTLQVPVEGLIGKAESLQAQLREQRRELARARLERSRVSTDKLFKEAVRIGDTYIVTHQFDNSSPQELRALADFLRASDKSVAAVLGSVRKGKAMLVMALTRDLVERGLSAGELIKEIAAVVGGGGGGRRQDLAEAGGPRGDKLEEALDKAREVIQARLGA